MTNCDHDWIPVKRRGRLSEFIDARMCKICGSIEDTPPTPPREQKPGDGRLQLPRRNEEKRPL